MKARIWYALTIVVLLVVGGGVFRYGASAASAQEISLADVGSSTDVGNSAPAPESMDNVEQCHPDTCASGVCCADTTGVWCCADNQVCSYARHDCRNK